MECYDCSMDAVRECPRCGALYCDDHGDAMCDRCMDPETALPSYQVFRGSLLALLAISVFAVWLLVRPLGGEDLDSVSGAEALAGAPTGEEAGTPDDAPADGGDGAAGEDAGGSGDTAGGGRATPTPSPSPTPTPSPTPEPEPETQTYTVQPGDTVLSIAEQFLPSGADVFTFADEIAAANGITDQSLIAVGQELVIP